MQRRRAAQGGQGQPCAYQSKAFIDHFFTDGCAIGDFERGPARRGGRFPVGLYKMVDLNRALPELLMRRAGTISVEASRSRCGHGKEIRFSPRSIDVYYRSPIWVLRSFSAPSEWRSTFPWRPDQRRMAGCSSSTRTAKKRLPRVQPRSKGCRGCWCATCGTKCRSPCPRCKSVPLLERPAGDSLIRRRPPGEQRLPVPLLRPLVGPAARRRWSMGKPHERRLRENAERVRCSKCPPRLPPFL